MYKFKSLYPLHVMPQLMERIYKRNFHTQPKKKLFYLLHNYDYDCSKIIWWRITLTFTVTLWNHEDLSLNYKRDYQTWVVIFYQTSFLFYYLDIGVSQQNLSTKFQFFSLNCHFNCSTNKQWKIKWVHPICDV